MEILRKEMKMLNTKIHTHINSILGVLSIAKGLYLRSYAMVLYKATVVTMPIPKRFNMLDIAKCDGTINPQEHLMFFIMDVNRNDMPMGEASL